MTPEERKGALVTLLGRVRSNAGTRLTARSGDEEEFVPKSVIAARAAAADAAAAQLDVERRAALDDALDADAIVAGTKPRFVPDDVPLDTDPPPTAVPGSSPGTLEEALRQAEESELERERAEAPVVGQARIESAPPTPRGELAEEAPSIEMGESAELELDLFDPFDEAPAAGASEEIEADILESVPPPPARPPVPPPRIGAPPAPVRPAPPAQPPPAKPAAQPPPAQPAAQSPPAQPPPPPASLTRAIPMRSSPTIESRAVPPAAPPPASPPAVGKLVRPPSPSSPGNAAEPVPPPPEPRAMQRPSTAPASRVEPTSTKPLSIELPFDEQTEEQSDAAARTAAEDVRIAEDDLEATVNMPPRKADPLAQTAQNPIPAAFERAVLRAEGALVPPLDAVPAERDVGTDPPPAGARSDLVAEAEEPVSSKQPLALDREGGELDAGLDDAGLLGDDGLPIDDDDEPPESGEIASQRQPATGKREPDLDLDEATPSTDQANAVAEEAMALLDAEAVPSAPPPTRPAVMGRRPVAVTSFLDVLDDALSLAE